MRPPASRCITSHWFVRAERETALANGQACRAGAIMSGSAYQALWITMAREFGVVVAPVEASDLHRKTIFAVVIIAGGVGAVRRRIGAEIVRELLEEARMVGVGAAAVRDAMAFDMAAQQVDDMETRLARGEREIDDPNRVAKRTIGCRVERRLGALEQRGIDAGGSRLAPPALRKTRERGRAADRSESGGRPTELAAEENSTPPAPAAPSRNISRRFNDIRYPPLVKRDIIRGKVNCR